MECGFYHECEQLQRKSIEEKTIQGFFFKFAARADLHHLGQFLAGREADAPQEAL